VRGSRTRDLAPVAALVTADVIELAPSRHWSAAVREQWSDFWSSPLADSRIVTSADRASLYRMFDYRQRLVEALEQFDAEPTTSGSTGQVVISPWSGEVHRLEAAIARLEDRFGCSPAARLKLGVSVAQAASHVAAAQKSRSAGRYSELRGRPVVDAVEGTGV
jgi:P27 family predicted phage terminase small subunit